MDNIDPKQPSGRNLKGFTVIEVMIVLAIGALILMMVFLAIPQLRRNQRDNARRDITNRIKAEMEDYAANNEGLYPFGGATDIFRWSDFNTTYITAKNIDVADPLTGAVVINGSPNSSPSPNFFSLYSYSQYNQASLPNQTGTLAIVMGAACSGEDLTRNGIDSLTARHFAIIISLDKPLTRFCTDNS